MRPRDRSVHHGPGNPWVPACSCTWSFPGAQPATPVIYRDEGCAAPQATDIFPGSFQSSGPALLRGSKVYGRAFSNLQSPLFALKMKRPLPGSRNPRGLPLPLGGHTATFQFLQHAPERQAQAGHWVAQVKDQSKAQPDLWDVQT